ncbi:MAG: excinuclease ABC subunit UvrA [Rickettsiales bacterium]|jgi:excinuclease ABC subunit A|nr:excinuclease ABC subunit UvrA [Rickettsiales bacterium]
MDENVRVLRNSDYIEIINARQNNLKNINVRIPKNKFIVITGLSGSGKSSLAFDTIYVEGQRRYIESLSTYARQFLNVQNKPDVDYITGLSPAIAIDQKIVGKNPRSTVGTATEIYDYLRILFARVGTPYSPVTGKPLVSQSAESMRNDLMSLPLGSKITIFIPYIRQTRGELRKDLIRIKKAGFVSIRVDGNVVDISSVLPRLNRTLKHDLDVILDYVTIGNNIEKKILFLIKKGLEFNNGVIMASVDSFPDGVEEFTIKKMTYRLGDCIRFSSKYSCPDTGMSINSIEPKMFSFNNPFGACPKCDGLGTELKFDEKLIVIDNNLSIEGGAIDPFKLEAKARLYYKVLDKLGKKYDFNIRTPFKNISREGQDVIFYGSEDEAEIEIEENNRTIKTRTTFPGVMKILEEKYLKIKDELLRDELAKYQSAVVCSRCKGYRLTEEALSIRIDGKNIGEVCDLSISECYEFFDKLYDKLGESEKIIADKILSEIKNRLLFLMNVGLEYLTLNRKSGTLSGGESQRIRLATQIATGLSGVIYVLDEPSIGLHQSDNQKLIKTMKDLRDLGNTVIVVEHDEETMLAADYIIDIGPGAGIHGGEIIAQGTPEEILKNSDSITGLYLNGKKTIPIPAVRRPINNKKKIILRNARGNNLKNVTAEFPLGVFCSVTGVSGGGKSTLVLQTLYRALQRLLMGIKVIPAPYDKIEGLSNVDKIIQIDQSPIGRTPRSNPCTYVGVFTYIRDLFASLPESYEKGFGINHFSFNVKGGRCEHCQGDGSIKIEMHFLPDVFIKCPVCNGRRYNREILEIEYNGKNIADILDMTVEEACKFFAKEALVYEKFKALKDVGLGYIKIGQSATTLSGGEAQRIKLAKELSKRDTGNTVYILDEPTTGLHSDDIKKLLSVLHKLVEQGNTVIVIEHNLDVVKTSDWIIDVGPRGGNNGGYIVAQGTPEDVAANENSITGKYLKNALEKYNKYIKNGTN